MMQDQDQDIKLTIKIQDQDSRDYLITGQKCLNCQG